MSIIVPALETFSNVVAIIAVIGAICSIAAGCVSAHRENEHSVNLSLVIWVLFMALFGVALCADSIAKNHMNEVPCGVALVCLGLWAGLKKFSELRRMTDR